MRPFLKYFYNHMIDLLPINPIKENDHWIAFYHPDPDYPLHILILPKRAIESLAAAPENDHGLYSDLFLMVKDLINECHISESGYRLITNGGPNQTIPQWHWHLISENPSSSCISSSEG